LARLAGRVSCDSAVEIRTIKAISDVRMAVVLGTPYWLHQLARGMLRVPILGLVWKSSPCRGGKKDG
jgi:hypothetical protein